MRGKVTSPGKMRKDKGGGGTLFSRYKVLIKALDHVLFRCFVLIRLFSFICGARKDIKAYAHMLSMLLTPHVYRGSPVFFVVKPFQPL